MSLSLICACGARIELEDALAGQEVACPECQQPLKAPAGTGQSQPIRTSGFALASLVLAVTGAFTVIGSLAAVVLGFVAVVMILRQRERLAGLGFAVAGIGIGGVSTALMAVLITLFFLSPDTLSFGFLRERNMTKLVDTTGPLEVAARGWSITRPTQQWGVARSTMEVEDPFADLFLAKATPDLVLVQIKHNGFVDVREEPAAGKELGAFFDEYISDYQSLEENPLAAGPQGKDEGFMRITNGRKTRGPSQTTAPPGCTGREAEMDLQVAGQKWVMVVRVYHNPKTKTFYVLRAYSPRRWFPQNKADFNNALDSFSLK